MIRLSTRLCLVLAASTIVVSNAAAQRKAAAVSSSATAQSDRPLLGAKLGFATNDFDFFIGGDFSYKVAKDWDLYPSLSIYFPSGASAWDLSADVRWWPHLNTPNSGLYTGGGLGFTSVSCSGCNTETRVGLDLLGGWQFKTSSGLLPFAELRAVIASDVDRLEFVGGINFKL